MDFKAEGKIIYDPTAGKAANKWWMIVECPQGILDYYYYWITRKTKIRIQKPLFGSHVSVIRGEEPSKEYQHLWRKHHEKTVTFYYEHEVFYADNFWWLRVKCDELKDIRKELGLNPEVEHGLHLTIGRKI